MLFKKLFIWTTFFIFVLEMNEAKFREVFAYKNYFLDFYNEQKLKVKEKILWTFKVIETVYKVPTDFLKHLEGTAGLFEVRVQFGSDIFRIFCFFDEDKLIVLMNGFQKKTQKTPKKEIEKALKIIKEYEDERKK